MTTMRFPRLATMIGLAACASFTGALAETPQSAPQAGGSPWARTAVAPSVDRHATRDSKAGLVVRAPRRRKFDDTQMGIINNGGDPNEVLCADRPIVGSRFIRHICMTRAQWSQLKKEQQFHADRFRRQTNDNGVQN